MSEKEKSLKNPTAGSTEVPSSDLRSQRRQARNSQAAQPEQTKKFEVKETPKGLTPENFIFFLDTEGRSMAFTAKGFAIVEGLAPFVGQIPSGGFQKGDYVLDSAHQTWEILKRLIEPTLSKALPARVYLVVSLVKRFTYAKEEETAPL